MEEEKKEFAIKNSNLKSENSKLLAENQVLDKALKYISLNNINKQVCIFMFNSFFLFKYLCI